MNPELQELIKENLALTKDNHQMLRAMRRDQWFGFIGKAIFWAVIIIAPLYYLQPYLKLLPSVAEFQANLQQIQQLQKK